MSTTLGVILMMNNYFHDVATALLLSSGAALWLMMKRLGTTSDEAVLRYFLDLHHGMNRLAKIALLWIVLGGIPRTIFYRRFEWANAAGKGQVPALIVKHVLFFLFLAAGAHLWFRINKRIKIIRNALS